MSGYSIFASSISCTIKCSSALDFRLPYPKSTTAVLFLESELLSILCLKASQDSQLWKAMATVWLNHMAISRSTVVRLCETCRSSMLEEHLSRKLWPNVEKATPRYGWRMLFVLLCHLKWGGATNWLLMSHMHVPSWFLARRYWTFDWFLSKHVCRMRFCPKKLIAAFLQEFHDRKYDCTLQI